MAELISGTRVALFYRGTYFLLAEGGEDVRTFMDGLRAHIPAEIEAVVLREEPEERVPGPYERGVCMAPYFITDYLEGPETIEIEDAADVFPVEVELLTQREYNDRLRTLVKERCPGCRGFGSVNDKDSSLSGHFSEMSLNGVCTYRWETRVQPRHFFEGLESLPVYWARYGFGSRNGTGLAETLRDETGIPFTGGERVGKQVTLHVKKPDFFTTALTQTMANFIAENIDEEYEITLAEQVPVTAEAVSALLAPAGLAATRKSLKKYGVALAEIVFDQLMLPQVAPVLNGMIMSGYICPLPGEDGRLMCLMTDVANTLVALRYWSPVLAPCHTQITVTDALRTARYQITFDLPCEVLEVAPAEPEKPKKAAPKRTKKEPAHLLTRDQAQNLFMYVQNRLWEMGCDDTLTFTRIWLEDNLPKEQREAVLEEILAMGGGCDCEVLANCYEDYELD